MFIGATAARLTLTGAGAKAAAEPTRAIEIAERSFMVTVLMRYCLTLMI
jgi:hypothetical protein